LGAVDNNEVGGDRFEDGSARGGAAAASAVSWDRNAKQVIAEVCIFTKSIPYDVARS